MIHVCKDLFVLIKIELTVRKRLTQWTLIIVEFANFFAQNLYIYIFDSLLLISAFY